MQATKTAAKELVREMAHKIGVNNVEQDLEDVQKDVAPDAVLDKIEQSSESGS